MTFESIVRKWCKLYRPILDSQESRKFFFTDSRENMIEMAKGWEPDTSPCVVMEGVAEGVGTIERMSMNYPICFCVRADKQKDGDATVLAVEEALLHMKKFLSWIKYKHDKDIEVDIDGDYARIDLDNSYFDVGTIGPFGDGWYAVLLQMVREEPLNLCVNPDDYNEEEC